MEQPREARLTVGEVCVSYNLGLSCIRGYIRAMARPMPFVAPLEVGQINVYERNIQGWLYRLTKVGDSDHGIAFAISRNMK
jgi:hypothetical protein